jgi:putative component of toxin-antitoxin plasmid stabilization module
MPVRLYRTKNRRVPVAAALRDLCRTERRAAAKCIALIERLRECGTDLRGKLAAYLKNGVWELRVSAGSIEYRIAYAAEAGVLVLLHGFRAHVADDAREYDRAIDRLAEFRANPDLHTARLEDAEAEECAALPALLFPV